MEPIYDEDGIQVYQGDCLEIMPNLPKDGVDMVLTDPPYGMGRVVNDGENYLDVVGPALRQAWGLLKDPGSMFAFASTGEVVNVANALGQPLRRLLWMYKPADCTFPLAGWLLTSEAILWFTKGKRINLAERRPYQHDCYVHRYVGREGVAGHPTVKPLWVVRDIASRCPVGGIIFDPFMGSGTTLVAARELGLCAIGIEIEGKYVDIAIRRLRQPILPIFRGIRKTAKGSKALI